MHRLSFILDDDYEDFEVDWECGCADPLCPCDGVKDEMLRQTTSTQESERIAREREGQGIWA